VHKFHTTPLSQNAQIGHHCGALC